MYQIIAGNGNVFALAPTTNKDFKSKYQIEYVEKDTLGKLQKSMAEDAKAATVMDLINLDTPAKWAADNILDNHSDLKQMKYAFNSEFSRPGAKEFLFPKNQAHLSSLPKFYWAQLKDTKKNSHVLLKQCGFDKGNSPVAEVTVDKTTETLMDRSITAEADYKIVGDKGKNYVIFRPNQSRSIYAVNTDNCEIKIYTYQNKQIMEDAQTFSPFSIIVATHDAKTQTTSYALRDITATGVAPISDSLAKPQLEAVAGKLSLITVSR
eukprot:GHVT01038558.1.p1 GENE.GHVT01038558.1~~GHVT01038558.1.p1  ORF type:complete len:265 (-),score=26.94 GHVT01038558.1:283-1077(-)